MWIETKDRLPREGRIFPVVFSRRGSIFVDFLVLHRKTWFVPNEIDMTVEGIIAWFDLPPYERSAEQLKREMGF